MQQNWFRRNWIYIVIVVVVLGIIAFLLFKWPGWLRGDTPPAATSQVRTPNSQPFQVSNRLVVPTTATVWCKTFLDGDGVSLTDVRFDAVVQVPTGKVQETTVTLRDGTMVPNLRVPVYKPVRKTFVFPDLSPGMAHRYAEMLRSGTPFEVLPVSSNPQKLISEALCPVRVGSPVFPVRMKGHTIEVYQPVKYIRWVTLADVSELQLRSIRPRGLPGSVNTSSLPLPPGWTTP